MNQINAFLTVSTITAGVLQSLVTAAIIASFTLMLNLVAWLARSWWNRPRPIVYCGGPWPYRPRFTSGPKWWTDFWRKRAWDRIHRR